MALLNEQELAGIYNMLKHLNDNNTLDTMVSFQVKVYASDSEQVGMIHNTEGEYLFDTKEVGND